MSVLLFVILQYTLVILYWLVLLTSSLIYYVIGDSETTFYKYLFCNRDGAIHDIFIYSFFGSLFPIFSAPLIITAISIEKLVQNLPNIRRWFINTFKKK